MDEFSFYQLLVSFLKEVVFPVTREYLLQKIKYRSSKFGDSESGNDLNDSNKESK